jgi:RNA polymerase sigma factor (sigma-70 family)
VLDGGEAVEIRPKGTFQRQLRTVFNLGTVGDLTDGQLLERFATRGGEAAELAFAALVERHGPMVLRVCRHAAGDPHDAEDSFQATFLILVKQARSLWVLDSLGPWLHRVAHRVATRARLSGARLREHERRAAAARPAVVRERGDCDEVAALLHEEVDRLPERYRVPVVLCDLQGVTHEKAARHLGWPVGTVKTRLARAREMLRGRLSRRGLGPPAGLMIPEKVPGGAFPFRAVEVVLPGTLIDSTVRAAAPVAAGKAVAVGVISSRVVILMEEVLKTMVVTKLKLAAVVVLIGTAGAAVVLAQQGPRSGANGAVDELQGTAAAEARRPARGQSGQGSVSAPAYIRQSRALIITRLEEEAAEAQARLDRTLKKFQSTDHPAVIRARETLDALVQRLDKIDRVLVDVVETYPTMVDFSGGPGGVNAKFSGEQTQREGWTDTVNARPFDQNQQRDARQVLGKGSENDQGQPADSPKRQGQPGQTRGDSPTDSMNDSEKRDERASTQLKFEKLRYFEVRDSKPGQDGQKRQDDSQSNQSKRGDNSQRPANGKQNDSGKQEQNRRDPAVDSQNDKQKQGEKGSLRDAGKGQVSQSDSKSGAQGHGSGIVTADLDGDGLVDIMVANDGWDGTKHQPQQGQSKPGSDQKAPNKSKPGQSKPNSEQNASKDSQQGQSKSGSDQNASNKSQPGQSKDGSSQKVPNGQSEKGQAKDGSSQKLPNGQSEKGQSKDGSSQKLPNGQAEKGQTDAVPF